MNLYDKRNNITLSKQLEAARTAVNEYPGELKYICWLADCTYLLAFEREDDSAFRAEREKALKLYSTVFENTDDPELKRQSNASIVMALSSLGRKGEAREYAELYPCSPSPDKQTVVEWTLEGEEKLRFQQNLLRSHFTEIIGILTNTKSAENASISDLESLIFAEKLIKFIVPDGNYLDFNDFLFIISVFKAQRYQYSDKEKAVECLLEARQYALEFDRLFTCKPQSHAYTTPLFNLLEIKTNDLIYDGTPEDNKRLDSYYWWLSGKCFDPLREYDGFKALLL